MEESVRWPGDNGVAGFNQGNLRNTGSGAGPFTMFHNVFIVSSYSCARV